MKKQSGKKPKKHSALPKKRSGRRSEAFFESAKGQFSEVGFIRLPLKEPNLQESSSEPKFKKFLRDNFIFIVSGIAAMMILGIFWVQFGLPKKVDFSSMASKVKTVQITPNPVAGKTDEPVKWIRILDTKDLETGQKYLPLPKGAENIKITAFSGQEEAQEYIEGQKEQGAQSTLTIEDRRRLAGILYGNIFDRIKQLLDGTLNPFLACIIGAAKNIAHMFLPEMATIKFHTTNKMIQLPATSAHDSTLIDISGQSSVSPPPQNSGLKNIINYHILNSTAGLMGNQVSLSTTQDPTQQDGIIVAEYTTPAPTIAEENADRGKIIKISAQDEKIILGDANPLCPKNAIAYAKIPEIYNIYEKDKIKINWANNNSWQVPFDAYDLNNNGKLDYIEWRVPHLSEQTFEIIYISKAFQLDSRRNILDDIYEKVRSKDGNWASLKGGQYVRVTFKKPLAKNNDITLYAKPASRFFGAVVEVYPKNSSLLVATFPKITKEGTYKIFLTNLVNQADTFDLKIKGSLDIDYIVDPANYCAGNWGGDCSSVSASCCQYASACYLGAESCGGSCSGCTDHVNDQPGCTSYSGCSWTDTSSCGGSCSGCEAVPQPSCGGISYPGCLWADTSSCGGACGGCTAIMGSNDCFSYSGCVWTGASCNDGTCAGNIGSCNSSCPSGCSWQNTGNCANAGCTGDSIACSSSCPSGCGWQNTGNCANAGCMGNVDNCGSSCPSGCGWQLPACAASGSPYGDCNQFNASESCCSATAGCDWDATAPVTAADGNGYTFGTWSNANVTVSLSCSDNILCNGTYYCTDANDLCTPVDSYGSSVVFSDEGTAYIRYYSVDSHGNEEAVTSSEIKIDKTGPSVDAGSDQTKTAQFTQTGSATDTGSGVATYLWSKVSGPGAITFGSATLAATTISASASGTYVIRLTATDGAGNFASDDFTLVRPSVVNISNIGGGAPTQDTTFPSVDAGSDQTKTAQFTQTGSATDTGSGVATYLWSKVSGPGAITFGSATLAATTISASASGTYVIRLTATDGAGNFASDDFTLVWTGGENNNEKETAIPSGTEAQLPAAPSTAIDGINTAIEKINSMSQQIDAIIQKLTDATILETSDSKKIVYEQKLTIAARIKNEIYSLLNMLLQIIGREINQL